MGIHMRDDKTIVYREWAPNAIQAALFGEFSM
jgi:1,4-alpha-glucan branching enzyme